MNILVSGLVNIETTLKVEGFPINYYPIGYPFYGIHSDVAGVAYNITKAFKKLGDSINLYSFVGNDEEALRILQRLKDDGIDAGGIIAGLDETPSSVVLYDNSGKRQIYCDLKNIQDKELDINNSNLARQIKSCDIVVACNINFNRTLIKKAKELGKIIATDVHVLSDIKDSFNKDFMEYADILFLSDEQLPCAPREFIGRLKEEYNNKVIVIGMGSNGAMLYDQQEDAICHFEAVKCDKVVNTVGAGDSLFTSFLHYYLKGYNPADALMRAEVFAALKIGHNGAANGFSSEEDIEKVFSSKKPAVLAV